MNRLLSKAKLLASRELRVDCLSTRGVTYDVLPSGEKVVVNKYDNKKTKREKWQYIRCMGYEPQLRHIKKIEFNPRQESDPRMARHTAEAKLESMKDSLRSRGFCREVKPYDPPKDVQNIIQNICQKVLTNETKSHNWSDISLSDSIIKYKFLTKCSKELNYEIPNSMLYLMKTVSDVLNFYSTPIRGISSYDQLVQNSHQLPPNLHVIAEPIRYNQENDTYFGGINAYPFSSYRVKGLRAKKKYPEFKSHFVWPDV